MPISLLSLSLNSLSAFSGIILFTLVLSLQKKKPEVVNIVYISQSFWIGLIDVVFHVVGIIYTEEFHNSLPKLSNQLIARILFAVPQMVSTWAMMMPVCIAFDLHLSFIYRVAYAKRIQNWYWIISLLCAVLCSLPYILLVDPEYFLKLTSNNDENPDRDFTQSLRTFVAGLIYLSWTFICVSYSFVVVAMVFYRLRKEFSTLNSVGSESKESKAKQRRLLVSVLFTLYYPFTIVLGTAAISLHATNAILEALEIPHGLLHYYIEFEPVIIDMSGTINLLIFLLHPTVKDTLENISWWPLKKKNRLHRSSLELTSGAAEIETLI
ncbi:uncharacterized protein VTP21DRAFT_5286 [Calcarisporiella thermophila]|uniref:uncharacterized protein n=1 Tax=Calcarisporiella thermophila TaxID=911321 RepID=UPI003742F9B3